MITYIVVSDNFDGEQYHQNIENVFSTRAKAEKFYQENRYKLDLTIEEHEVT